MSLFEDTGTWVVDPYTSSMIALRTLLDGLRSERIGVGDLATRIGAEVEHEAQVRAWEKLEPDLFYKVQNHLDRTDATSHHRRLVNINRFNDLLAKGQFGFGWERWPDYDKYRVGVFLVDNIIRVTQWFDFVDDPFHVWRKGKISSPKLCVIPRPGLSKHITAQLSKEADLSPSYMPTVVPPKPWESTRGGGYHTPYVKSPRLIRFKASQIDQRDRAADEYEALDMPQVYAAINYLQEVPWRVNKRVLAVMSDPAVIRLGIGKLPTSEDADKFPEPPKGLPEQSDFIKLNMTADKKAYGAAMREWEKRNPKVLKRWKHKMSAAIRRNVKREAQLSAFNSTIEIAKKYVEFDAFYFPHMMDFRGRMYPIPVGLQPQGADFARGLLEFSEGKPVAAENEGGNWIAIQVAAAWGNDKIPYEKRLKWVAKNEDMWRRIAADPIRNKDWVAADKPWAVLAAIFDWVAYLDHGDGYVSHLPVSVDGTCNGIQHLSAMTLDKVSGELVNLVPGKEPRDIYKHVGKLLQALMEDIVKTKGQPAEHAKWWLELCSWKFDRSLTKRQVMVIPYGGTRDSFFTYTRKWLDDNHPFPNTEPKADELKGLQAWLKAQPAKDRAVIRERAVEREQSEMLVASQMRNSQRIGFLAKHMWSICEQTVSGGMQVMTWLQKTAAKVTRGNQPIFWVTPTGFVVRHFYGKQIEYRVRSVLNGENVDVQLRTTTKDLDVKAQLQGISPNFVHSMDASALIQSMLYAQADGITGFTAIHDAYGTHAADMWKLFAHLRQAFVDTHTEDVLENFRQACMSVLVGLLVSEGKDPLEAAQIAEEQIDPPPSKGDLDLNDVLRSDYFFA